MNTDWTFRQVQSDEWMNAKIPGSVQSNLFRLKKIPDPYVGKNETEIQWIESKDWEFKTEFAIEDDILEKQFIELIFNGIDTYSDVFLNGQKILSSDNMFRSYTIDIKSFAKTKNTLIVKLYSPIEKVRPKFESLPYTLPASNDVGKIKVSPHVRKAQSHFGWDWGPRIVTIGIWKSVELVSYDENKIIDLNVIQKNHSSERVSLDFEIETKHPMKSNDRFQITISDDSTSIKTPWFSSKKFSLDIENPKYWWVHTLGNPHLYKLNLEYQRNESPIDKRTQSLGIRTIELIQDKDSIGTAFYFKLNGQPVYMKGANVIPQDALLSRVQNSDQDRLISDAVESHMNMLRIWGGGIYQNDYFYDLADQNGILIWQDFMFACSMYPGDPEFVHTVREELKEQIIRLRQHPSIALWNGNNEVDVAWHNWGWQSEYNLDNAAQTQIWSDYQQLFHNLIPSLIDSLSPQIPYTSTSPLSNWGTADNFNHSSMHYWGVWHGEDEFEEFGNNVPRFMSEYGFQSFPELATNLMYADSTALNLESDVMKWHQKSYKGNRLLTHHIEQYFNPAIDFKDFLYKSQLTQAKAIEMAIDAHRSNQPKNMGTLYWQMNDNWPGPTWSGIDYFGRWKAMQFAVKRAYAPDRVIITENKTDIIVQTFQENTPQFRRNSITATLVDIHGNRTTLSIPQATYNASIFESTYIFKKADLPEFDKTQSVFIAELEKKNTDVYNIHYFVRSKDFKLNAANVSISLSHGNQSTTIRVTSPTIVKSLYLSVKGDPDVRFSDNYFDLIPDYVYFINVSKKINLSDLQTKFLNPKSN